MNPGDSDPIALALMLGTLALLPLAVTMTTSFLKISMVLVILRNALGVQQAPPAMALNGIALAMTMFVMAPTFDACLARYQEPPRHSASNATAAQLHRFGKAFEPLREFMLRNSRGDQRRLFVATTRQTWPAAQAAAVKETDWAVLVPAFVVSELIAGFEIGFLLYIPFIVIDLLVSNVLLALGMQMVSPVMLSIPLKILLFVAIDGWGRLLNALVLSYRG